MKSIYPQTGDLGPGGVPGELLGTTSSGKLFVIPRRGEPTKAWVVVSDAASIESIDRPWEILPGSRDDVGSPDGRLLFLTRDDAENFLVSLSRPENHVIVEVEIRFNIALRVGE